MPSGASACNTLVAWARFRSVNELLPLIFIDTIPQLPYNEISSSTNGRRRIRTSDRGPALFFSDKIFIFFIKPSFIPRQYHRVSRHQMVHINITVLVGNTKYYDIVHFIVCNPDKNFFIARLLIPLLPNSKQGSRKFFVCQLDTFSYPPNSASSENARDAVFFF